MLKNFLPLIIIAFLLLLLYLAETFIPKPTLTNEVDVNKQVIEPTTPNNNFNETSQNQPKIETVVSNLEIPWELVFLPSGELLVTERSGNLIKIGETSEKIKIEGVEHVGEGGLLGLVLHPNFETNSYIYLYLTSIKDNQLVNRVERYKLLENKLTEKTVIVDNIKGAMYHDGGRIEFGPDNKLYITTGDATKTELAQDLNSLSGKILRVNDDGSIPNDNSFSNKIYSFGHRNPQGLTWDSNGHLYSTEHGRSGVASGFDELNLIKPGQNYGWPKIQGSETNEKMISPILHSGANNTWAPGDIEFVNGYLLFVGLRGQAIYKVTDFNTNPQIKEYFKNEFGRIRAIKKGPDNYIYITTSNRDGRGTANEGDDKIIRIKKELFD